MTCILVSSPSTTCVRSPPRPRSATLQPSWLTSSRVYLSSDTEQVDGDGHYDTATE